MSITSSAGRVPQRQRARRSPRRGVALTSRDAARVGAGRPVSSMRVLEDLLERRAHVEDRQLGGPVGTQSPRAARSVAAASTAPSLSTTP